MRRMFVALAFMGVALFGAFAAHGSTTNAHSAIHASANPLPPAIAAIKKRGVLRVGVGLYAPTSAQKPDGSLAGVDIDVLKRLATSLHVKAQFTVVGYDVIVAGLQTGKYDITTALIKSPVRLKAATFSNTLYSVDELFVVRADSPYRTLADLNNPNVIVDNIVGSYDQTIRQKYIPNSTSHAVAGYTLAQEIADLMAKKCDAVNVETPFTTLQLKKQFGSQVRFIPNVDAGQKPLESAPAGYVVKKGNTALAARVNSLLASLNKNGTTKKLFAKYTAELLKPLTP